ncbi:MAG: DUF2807 domain-containing protein [Flavobacterium sp.]|nr:DUF2807 domain-containing protein [Candidatus Neoflavobacterium equi]
MNLKGIVLFLATTAAFAQGPITKNVGEVTSVKSFDKISVQLIKSNENKVVLSGNESEYVELVNKNGELKVKMPLKKTLKGQDVVAKVYYTGKITEVNASEYSYISSEDVMESLDFTAAAKEGANVKLKVNTKKLDVKVTSGAEISIDGQTKNQSILVNSGGKYKAKNLKSDQCSVTVNAGGEAEVSAEDIVNAKVRAGGVIDVYGNPKLLNEEKVVGGTINQHKS